MNAFVFAETLYIARGEFLSVVHTYSTYLVLKSFNLSVGFGVSDEVDKGISKVVSGRIVSGPYESSIVVDNDEHVFR